MRRSRVTVSHLALVVMISGFLASLGVALGESATSVRVNVRAGGGPARAMIKISMPSERAREVARGDAGGAIAVPPGSYDLTVTCLELLDQPTVTVSGVAVQGGKALVQEVTFPAGTVVVNVAYAGKLIPHLELLLRKRPGRVGAIPLPQLAASGVPFKLSPGQYEAEVTIPAGIHKAPRGDIKQTIGGIDVVDGQTKTVSASF
jgi:hypothetical protein